MKVIFFVFFFSVVAFFYIGCANKTKLPEINNNNIIEYSCPEVDSSYILSYGVLKKLMNNDTVVIADSISDIYYNGQLIHTNNLLLYSFRDNRVKINYQGQNYLLGGVGNIINPTIVITQKIDTAKVTIKGTPTYYDSDFKSFFFVKRVEEDKYKFLEASNVWIEFDLHTLDPKTQKEISEGDSSEITLNCLVEYQVGNDNTDSYYGYKLYPISFYLPKH